LSNIPTRYFPRAIANNPPDAPNESDEFQPAKNPGSSPTIE